MLSHVQRSLVSGYSASEKSKTICDDMVTNGSTVNTTFNPLCFSTFEAIAAGAEQYRLGDSTYWFPSDGEGGFVTDAVDRSTVQAGIDAHGGETGFLLIDIETNDSKTLLTDRSWCIDNYSLAAEMWREQTDRDLAFYNAPVVWYYDLAPSFKSAVDGSSLALQAKWRALITSWQIKNDANYADLRQYIDIIVPKVYVQYSDSIATWNWIAHLMIQEAARIAAAASLPVYPILWHSAQADEVFLTQAEYEDALQKVAGMEETDGTVLWSGGSDPVEWTFTDVVSALVNQTGEFAPPPP